MKIYGYCRVSTPKQNIQRQIDNIIAVYSDAEIIAETYTGATSDRPQWIKLKRKIMKLTEPVTIVFDSVSRMSHNADEGFKEFSIKAYRLCSSKNHILTLKLTNRL